MRELKEELDKVIDRILAYRPDRGKESRTELESDEQEKNEEEKSSL